MALSLRTLRLVARPLVTRFYHQEPCYTVDLRSDVLTKPSPAMREAMIQATYGDDVFQENQTVNGTYSANGESRGFLDQLLVEQLR